MTLEETGCCPRFDPAPWEDTTVDWEDKLFLKDSVRCLFRIPLNFGSVMTRNMERIGAADAGTPGECLVLSDCVSLWRTDVFLHVSKEVPGAEHVRLTGRYRTAVFEGHYKNSGCWAQEMTDRMQAEGEALKKILFYYTTCPKCAEAYGKNYVVLLAQV